MSFGFTLVTVATMLAYAVPGYLLVKTKAVKPDAISAFAKLLMYVCQPCLTAYSLLQAKFSKVLFGKMAVFFLISLLLMLTMLLLFKFIYRNKNEDIRYRISNVAVCFGNCGFFGVPILQALLPEYPDVVVFSTMMCVAMNMLGWTAASAIITRDKKYISIKKVVLNPAFIGLVAAMPLFLLGISLPSQIYSMVTLLGKMTTPLCMLILGMRLSTVRIRDIFTSPIQYITVIIKQMIMPLVGMAVIWFIPFIDLYIKQAMVIMCCCPVASIVLNFSELLGEGQKTAANMLLLGSMMSVITMPLMLWILL